MRKAFLSLLVSVFSMAVHAVEAKLQVWQADGEVVTFDLDEEPVTTYADGNLVIKTSTRTITYPLEKVRKFTYFIPNNRTLGDADGNGVVDDADVVEVSNKILGKPSDKFVEANADVNGDGKVNTVDIVLIINSILTAQ
jgi:hypothetical protein